VRDTLSGFQGPAQAVILDPWYNKGFGGVLADAEYDEWVADVVRLAGTVADHVFVWGFPEIVWRLLNRLPSNLVLLNWLTWYFKNCPSVIRGWRSAQNACLHLVREGAQLYPEHFLNSAQIERKQNGKLRYMPGPASVIEASLNIGFVGKDEQTGHPSQKPEAVFEPLVLMSTQPGDLIIDPMCGSGTTGAVCRRLNRRALLCDCSEEYICLVEQRLGIQRSRK
jgi:site-specific DNA-methyltransferase (adenine-specific)